MNNEAALNNGSKRPYSSPMLKTLGGIAEITQGGGTDTPADSGTTST